MTKEDVIWVASKVFEKGWDYETLKYSDDLHFGSEYADVVWEYAEEMRSIGRIAFYEKYTGFRFY